MTYQNGVRSGLLDTISTLRLCNELQSEVIANMEQYQTIVVSPGEQDTRSGRQHGYQAELSYLHERKDALDTLISAVERYCAAAEGGIVASPAID
jgi:hypothetical protein